MRSEFDLSPLFRYAVGFDRLVNTLANSAAELSGYPPFNILKTDEDHYRVEVAVAGFDRDDLTVKLEDGTLVIAGSRDESDDKRQYMHRGIATRAFERRFSIADHIRIESASLVSGILSINMAREVPEHLRPRTIPINAGPDTEDGGADSN